MLLLVEVCFNITIPIIGTYAVLAVEEEEGDEVGGDDIPNLIFFFGVW